VKVVYEVVLIGRVYIRNARPGCSVRCDVSQHTCVVVYKTRAFLGPPFHFDVPKLAVISGLGLSRNVAALPFSCVSSKQ
jgi:hypothetical protein